MKRFGLAIVALCAGIAAGSQSQAFERIGNGPGHWCPVNWRATLNWDGRCDQTTYLPPTFRDYAQPRQLGPNAYMYWRNPQCAEDQYGYGAPGFNFFTVPGTYDPSQGLNGGDDWCQPHSYGELSKRSAGMLQR